MTTIKNNILVINLTRLILLGVITPISAQTSIAIQESRLDALSDLSYQIKVSKSKVELSKSKAELAKLKIKKQCLENKGCNLSGGLVLKKTPRPLQTTLIKELNKLSISAIINQRVAFKDIEGSFQQGDALYDSGIKIISITQSGVVLSTENNLKKTLTMDFIND